MKQRLTFITDAARPTAPLLLHFVIVLHQFRINPIAFTCESAQERGEDTVWLLVLPEGPRFAEFRAAVEATAGVQHVAATLISPPPPMDVAPD